MESIGRYHGHLALAKRVRSVFIGNTDVLDLAFGPGRGQSQTSALGFMPHTKLEEL